MLFLVIHDDEATDKPQLTIILNQKRPVPVIERQLHKKCS